MFSEPYVHRAGPLLIAFRRGNASGKHAASAGAHRGLIANWFDENDPLARDAMIDILELCGAEPNAGLFLPTSALVTILEQALENGDLCIETRREGFNIFRAEDRISEAPPPEPSPTKTSWVAIRLVDDQDNPVPYKRYRIETPEGITREGVTDDQGRARVDGIEAGTCRVTFPGLDARTWRKK